MKETELKPNGDCEYQVDKIIERILLGASRFQMHGEIEKPTVFMSSDMITDLKNHLECWRPADFDHGIETVCGYNVKLAVGKNVLYMGFEL